MTPVKLTTLSPEVFNEKKQLALKNQVLRKKMPLSDIKVIDDGYVVVDGMTLRITDHAFDDLRAKLKIPVKFLERFGESFTHDGKIQFINRLKDALAAHDPDDIILVANSKRKEVVRILNKNKASISNSGFIGYAEKLIEQWELKVVAFTVTDNGEFSIDTVSPAKLARIHRMDTEDFFPGLSFILTLNYGCEMNPYVNRNFCTNGLTTRSFKERFRLKDLTLNSIKKFNDEMAFFYHHENLIPSGYLDKLRTATTTVASVFEMEVAEELLTDTGLHVHEVQKFVKSENVRNIYERRGPRPVSKMSVIQRKNAPTDITMWNLVNGLTFFVSHLPEFNYNIAPEDQMHITNEAGKLLMKDRFDMQNRIESPFHKTLN